MADKLQYHEIMWAEQRPDVYAGRNCDQHRPRWHCYAEGDKDSEDGLQRLALAAKHFPAGTKVVVSVPVCPNPECAMQVELCECGFDWKKWAEEQYS